MSSDNPSYQHFKLWQGIGVFLVLAVIYLSLTPNPPMMPLDIEWGDKLGHFLAYFSLMAWHSQLYHSLKIKSGLLAGFIAMGVGLEFLQGMGDARMFEWADAIANSIGAVIAFAASYTRFAFMLYRFEKRVTA